MAKTEQPNAVKERAKHQLAHLTKRGQRIAKAQGFSKIEQHFQNLMKLIEVTEVKS